MVDSMRRKQTTISLCTYADVICVGGGGGGGGDRARAHQTDSDSDSVGVTESPPTLRRPPAELPTLRRPLADMNDNRAVPAGDSRGVSLRHNSVWLEPLHESLTPGPRSPAGHRRATCGPTRRRASPRAAASWDSCVTRGPRGLGFSIESAAPGWPGQVKVKRVFPHQPAADTGAIQAGDLLLRVNQLPMRGLSVQDVLHVLRLAGSEVLLSLARPDSDAIYTDGDGDAGAVTWDKYDGLGPVSRSSSRGTLRSTESDSVGTFTIEMQKINNSLGLSLRRTDDTVLGHTVKAKVREPALSDTRVRSGDKLIQVNGADTTAMSHAELVTLLRQCSERVTLTLYRDGQATPSSPASPVASRSTRLRPEAVEMLSGLAFRRELSQLDCADPPSPAAVCSRTGSRNEHQRRLSCGSRGSLHMRRRRTPAAGTGGTPSPEGQSDPEDPFSRLSGIDDVDAVTSERLNQLTSFSESSGMDSAAVTSLDHQQPTIVTSLEHLGRISESSGGGEDQDSDARWPDSDDSDDSDAELHERHLRRVTGGGEVPAEARDTARRRQVYLSVQPQQRVKPGEPLKRVSSEEQLERATALDGQPPPGHLTRWKGFTFADADQDGDSGAISAGASVQTVVIQLRRGWSTRLGFSLHSPSGDHIVSQIHPDSVTARDGRLKVGDLLLKVNDTQVKGLTSEEVISLLRTSKGAISLTVIRH